MSVRLVASCLLLLLATACDQQSTTPATDAQAFDLPADQVATGVRQNLTFEGIRRAVINSDTLYAYEGTRQVDMIGVDVVFYDEAGNEMGTLTSDSGEYNMANNNFTAKENVVLISQGPNGERKLYTEELSYDVGTDRLWSDQPFTLEEGGRTSAGTSFRSNSTFETWTVTGGQTTGTVDDEGGLSF